MSGIFGLYNSQASVGLTAPDQAIASLPSGDRLRARVEYVLAPHILLGRVHFGVFDQPVLVTPTAGTPAMVSSGYCADDSGQNLGWSRSNLSALQHMLERDDHDGLARLNGTFQCAHLSSDQTTLKLINGRFGLMPLFVCERPPLFAFAPDLPLLLTLIRESPTDSDFHPAVDRSALAEWFEIGMVMGERTLLQDISMMSAGTVLTWDGQRSRRERYWRPRFCEENHPFDASERGEALDAALRRSLRRRIGLDKRVCVSLSGGLDSRLLLGASVREGLSVSALTFGPEHSDDHTIASAVAECLDVAHYRFFDLPDAAAASFDPGIQRTAGMSNVLDLWGLQHGTAIHDVSDMLLNGIGGNELLGFLAFDLLRFKLPRSRDYLTRWLLRKLNPGWRESDRAMLRRTLVPDETPLSERIDSFWTNCPAKSPMARIYHFYLEEKSRKSNALGVATDDLFIDPVAPFLDNDIVDLALQMPPHQRLLARFYRSFFATHYPKLAALPYSRTGLPVNASPAKILAGKLIRRLSPGQHSHESPWTQWLRRDLDTLVRERLLDQHSPILDLLPREIVHGGVNAFMAGEPMPATLAIGQLLSLESFLRQFKPSLM